MITIIGDSSDELTKLQHIIDSGIFNLKIPSGEEYTLDITYKLSSGNILLINQYDHIVGEKQPDNR